LGSLAGLLKAAGQPELIYYLNKCSRVSCVSFAFQFGKAIFIAPITTSGRMGRKNYRKIKL
jgi:hypothetical protein